MTETDEAPLTPPEDLEAELETFRIDEETAQQFFFAYLCGSAWLLTRTGVQG